jgi:hypothetical protein
MDQGAGYELVTDILQLLRNRDGCKCHNEVSKKHIYEL